MEVLPTIEKTIIYDGTIKNDIPNGYGENDWYVTYEDSLKGYFRHIKTNRNDNHKYLFRACLNFGIVNLGYISLIIFNNVFICFDLYTPKFLIK
ncbi:MAG: hypothetical protein LBE36_08655 [Flavobacteriaceae bacterium]|jgi:hypothetical protein|nr:hypothetical protein [Flavobacteriaceae bacterium]